MFYDQAGVGKTSSFMLYSYLMDYLVAYKLKNKAEAKKLEEKTRIQTRKVFYWSFP